MNTQIYEALENTDISWYCCNCGLPNFNTSLFEDFVELSTPINTTTDTDGSILDEINLDSSIIHVIILTNLIFLASKLGVPTLNII
jgi:hypothetical protein